MLYGNTCICDCTNKVSGKLRLSLAEFKSELSVRKLQVPGRLFPTYKLQCWCIKQCIITITTMHKTMQNKTALFLVEKLDTIKLFAQLNKNMG